MACKTNENRMITTMEKTGELVEYRPVKPGLNQTAGTSLKKKTAVNQSSFKTKMSTSWKRLGLFSQLRPNKSRMTINSNSTMMTKTGRDSVADKFSQERNVNMPTCIICENRFPLTV